ncbi:hypothetical protein R1sor_001454 [Riccia sorocarpa]|uniref:DUF659 domain-containing protein n=1 Tax=Riccia sorocarpa TaxID=122646 RepID=A0ABD3GW04_9MARC
MKTENVEAGPSGPDAGLPQPRDEAGKFTIKHYVVLPDQKPGNPRIRCRYCSFEITYNITRMKHHLIGLKAAPPKAATALNKKGKKTNRLVNLFQLLQHGVQPSFARPVCITHSNIIFVGWTGKCLRLVFFRAGKKNDIRYYHDMKQQHEADKKWARAVYELGLPFNIFTHKVFKEAYEFSKHLPGYVLPGPKKLSNDLLEDEFKEVKDRTEKLMFPPLGFSKVTITCDGWTNIQGRPIVNFLIVNKYGEMYHNSVDCSGI